MEKFSKHPSFIIHSNVPFNGGAPLDLLREHFVTPSGLFYVRNHGTVPTIDTTSRYRLNVGGLVNKPLALSLDELKNIFPKRRLTVTLECAGNRRDELINIAPTPGETPWGAEAISNAEWRGVALWEVLLAAEVAERAQYVTFTGLDEVERDGRKFGFGGSIPIDKATRPEVLLAYEMNGEPLAPEHGFPLRVVTPGYIGARSVKWLSNITLQAEPSANYFQAHAYQLFPPQTDSKTADWSKGFQLGELSVNAAICAPRDGAETNSPVLVQGYALSGGHRIERLDLSTDDGATWVTAHLAPNDSPWAWTFWEAELSLAPGVYEIVARAWDSAANTQPEDAAKIWNFKGYMNNAWHRVKVRVSESRESANNANKYE
jgi:sulfite oxidase